jgi:hypothetical protein
LVPRPVDRNGRHCETLEIWGRIATNNFDRPS